MGGQDLLNEIPRGSSVLDNRIGFETINDDTHLRSIISYPGTANLNRSSYQVANTHEFMQFLAHRFGVRGSFDTNDLNIFELDFSDAESLLESLSDEFLDEDNLASEEHVIFRRLSDARYEELIPLDPDGPNGFNTAETAIVESLKKHGVNPWYLPEHEDFSSLDEGAPWEGIGTGWFYSQLGGGVSKRPETDSKRIPLTFDNTYEERMRGDGVVPTVFNGNFDAQVENYVRVWTRVAPEVPGWSFHNGSLEKDTGRVVPIPPDLVGLVIPSVFEPFYQALKPNELELGAISVLDDLSDDDEPTNFAANLGPGSVITKFTSVLEALDLDSQTISGLISTALDTAGNISSAFEAASSLLDIDADLIRQYVELLESFDTLTHNRTYLPTGYGRLRFDLQVEDTSEDDLLNIYMKRASDQSWNLLGDFSLEETHDEFETLFIDIPDYFHDEFVQFSFQLSDPNENGLDSNLLLDNIFFSNGEIADKTLTFDLLTTDESLEQSLKVSIREEGESEWRGIANLSLLQDHGEAIVEQANASIPSFVQLDNVNYLDFSNLDLNLGQPETIFVPLPGVDLEGELLDLEGKLVEVQFEIEDSESITGANAFIDNVSFFDQSPQTVSLGEITSLPIETANLIDDWGKDHFFKLEAGQSAVLNKTTPNDWGTFRLDLFVPESNESNDNQLAVIFENENGEIDRETIFLAPALENYDFGYNEEDTYRIGYGYTGFETFHVESPNLSAEDVTVRIENSGNFDVYIDDPLFKSVHLSLGNPSANGNQGYDPFNVNDFFVEKPQYTLSYNDSIKGPNWVAWQLNSSWLGAITRPGNSSSSNSYQRPPIGTTPPILPNHTSGLDYSYAANVGDWPWLSEESIPRHLERTDATDYRRNNRGLHRGHLTPSQDRTRHNKDVFSTFSTANLSPQHGDSNALNGAWFNFEGYLSQIVQEPDTAFTDLVRYT